MHGSEIAVAGLATYGWVPAIDCMQRWEDTLDSAVVVDDKIETTLIEFKIDLRIIM